MSEITQVPSEQMEQIKEEMRKRKTSRLFQFAEKYGIIKRGYTAIDYLRYAIKNFGWESTSITGIKASAKSNLMLQRGYAIYQDWNVVDKHTVTEPEGLIEILETPNRIPWLGIDDIGVHFPRSIYFTNRKLYSELQRNWESIRTKINCFDFTATRKNKVATFILEDITGDIICYNRQGEIKSHYDYQRWMWLRDLKDPTNMIAKPIRIEDIPFPLIPESFGLDTELREGKFLSSGQEYKGEEYFKEHAYLGGVPRAHFQQYWERRLALAQKAHARFKEIFLKQAAVKQKPPPPSQDEASQSASNLAKRRWHTPSA